ncbi:MAG: cation transporter [Bacteroidetes bacterium]|nr:cation transporter [Bacteroidota bacterium]MBS1607229.1 cation transporter [Bacteroidota bacterium]
MVHKYLITGMTCNSCVAKVKSELLKLGDIEAAEVQLQSPQATITMGRHIPTPVLQEAVRKAGHYTIVLDEDMTHNRSNDVSNEGMINPSYFPIVLIFGYIGGVSVLAQFDAKGFDWMLWMRHFMAGFFFVFSFFKLMNLRGFAEGYSSYDIVAEKFPAWGFIYPFVELALGIAYLTNISPIGTNSAAFLVMGISSIGVIKSLLRKSSFQCACLGTIIKLPLSKVTLFEDLLMAGMSVLAIISILFFHQ